MKIDAFLPNVQDLDQLRGEMYFIRKVLAAAMHEHANAALVNAQEAFDIGRESGPVVATFAPQAAYTRNVAMCQEAIQATMMLNTGILEVEHTTTPEIDDENSAYKYDTLNMHQVSAMLEAAQNRMNMALATISDNAGPGMRCVGSVLQAVPQDPEDDEHPDA